jgi:2-polyprenyl-3-methyl-5-hydroxy-6-metoxy-1,4-benzoquinol methylase
MVKAAKPKSNTGHYDANYGNFESELYAEIRREAYGQDIGQNSWLTADEQDRFIQWLALSSGKKLLDIACGAGGPALRIVEKTGCSLVGIDVHEQAVSAARSLAAKHRLAGRAQFQVVIASSMRLPVSTQSIICQIDHRWLRSGRVC